MQEAIMLAYARDGRTIANNLLSVMSENLRMESLATIELPQICSHTAAIATSVAEAVHVSRHRRKSPWPDNKGNATDICVYHLWHQCD